MNKLILLAALLLMLAALPAQIYAAVGDVSETRVSITGQVLDEAGDPLENAELAFSVYRGRTAKDVETTVRTEEDGMFVLELPVSLQAYADSGLECVVVQASVRFAEEVSQVDYQGGSPRTMSQLSDLKEWAADGLHQGNSIQLFHSLRTGEENAGEETAAFEDMEIILGSQSDPCLFQVQRTFNIAEHFVDENNISLESTKQSQRVGREQFDGSPPQELTVGQGQYRYAGWRFHQENQLQEGFPSFEVTDHHEIDYVYQSDYQGESTLLTIKHLNWADDQALSEEKTYILIKSNIYDSLRQETEPVLLDESLQMAPLLVMLNGVVERESQRGSPLTGYTVELTDLPPGELELVYYYHQDLDGDGIPDHQVTERFVTTSGTVIEGLPEQIRAYAHREDYQENPPVAAGYRFQNAQKQELGRPSLSSPAENVITSDTLYVYHYREDSGGASSGAGKEDGENGKPEPEGPEPKEEEPATDPPVVGEPEPEEETPPEEDLESGTGILPEAPAVLKEAEAAAGRSETENALEEETQQPAPSVTFVKRSLRKEVGPGQEVAYAFEGFENGSAHSLADFTILDRPDPGLDFISLQLPAFQEGADVLLDVSYVTNMQNERTAVQGHAADTPLKVNAPVLRAGEHVTEVYVRMGTVPPGFGVGDQVLMTFRVWENPPEEELHNLGMFYYRDGEGRLLEQSSGGGEDDGASVWVRLKDAFSSGDSLNGSEAAGSDFSGSGDAPSSRWRYLFLGLILAAAITVFHISRKRYCARDKSPAR